VIGENDMFNVMFKLERTADPIEFEDTYVAVSLRK
jgi:hypothetical protein